MKHTKKYLAVFMAISILLCSIIAVTSFAANRSQGDNEAEIEELQPMVASGCSPNVNHYVPTEFWPNGNIKKMENWYVNRYTGNRAGPTHTIHYPEDGDECLPPYGEENGFKGCKCPNCVGLYT